MNLMNVLHKNNTAGMVLTLSLILLLILLEPNNMVSMV